MKINGTIKKTTKALLVWRYSNGSDNKGDIYSQHKTYAAADKAINRVPVADASHLEIISVSDISNDGHI